MTKESEKTGPLKQIAFVLFFAFACFASLFILNPYNIIDYSESQSLKPVEDKITKEYYTALKELDVSRIKYSIERGITGTQGTGYYQVHFEEEADLDPVYFEKSHYMTSSRAYDLNASWINIDTEAKKVKYLGKAREQFPDIFDRHYEANKEIIETVIETIEERENWE